MLKETETEETTRFLAHFLSLVEFRLGGGPGPLGLCSLDWRAFVESLRFKHFEWSSYSTTQLL